ncbi:MAG: type II toxin-antitoxin system prevent-host-death family antitoxin [Bryobacteraceae bacterium]|nr:type II toxin-antitoxin system prevent-host-death family antitoxin [Bryobacteraceae bacterium]
MAQFNVHEAKSNLSQLLEMVERGEEVTIARNGMPVARMISVQPPKSILGIGIGDSNYLGTGKSDDEIMAPLSAAEIALWEGE